MGKWRLIVHLSHSVSRSANDGRWRSLLPSTLQKVQRSLCSEHTRVAKLCCQEKKIVPLPVSEGV